MPLSDIFQVNIVTSSPGLTAPGFGIPLIFGAFLKTWTERYREYTDIDAVADDFRTDEPEYLMAAVLFAQNPRPSIIAVGRGELSPTQRWKITPTAQNSTDYDIRIGDKTASYTSDSSATVAEICTGLTAAIDALMPAWQASHAYVSGDRVSNGGLLYECTIGGTSAASGGPTGYTSDITDGSVHWKYISAAATASDQTTYVQVTLTTAGNWLAVEADNVALLSVEQDHADAGSATDLAAIRLENDSWYALLYPFNSADCIETIADWVEAAGKMYVAQTQDSPVAAVAESIATDIGKVLKVGGYARTHLWYHPATDAFLDAGVSGVCLPIDPGQETWKFKQPATVPAVVITPTQKTNLDDKYVNYYYQVDASLSITGEGKVSANEWIDVIRGRDALAAEIQTAVINALTDSAISKIPYTDAGIQVIAGVTLKALRLFEKEPGFLVPLSSETNTPLASEVSDEDKQNRVFNDLTWSSKLQGAIHSGSINGRVTY